MNLLELQRTLAHGIAIQPGAFTKVQINRQHIFTSLARDLAAECDTNDRLRLLHEFWLIERIVEAAQKEVLFEAKRWHAELVNARRAYGASNVPQDALDALLLPALALIEYKEGRADAALAMLDESIQHFHRLAGQGNPDAGVALIEQRLNQVRTISRSGDGIKLLEAIFDFIETLARDCQGLQGETTPLRGDAGDAADILRYYCDEAILKAFEQLERPMMIQLLKMISGLTDIREDAAPLRYTASLLLRVIGSSDASADVGVLDATSLFASPPSLLMALCAVTSDHSIAELEDEYRTALEQHADYARHRKAFSRLAGFNS